MMVAASARAGDFANAADAGHAPHVAGVYALIAFGLLIVGTVIVLLKWHKSKLPVVSLTTVITTIMGLHAGDFADAADRGYRAWNGRSDTAISSINAIGRAAGSVTPEGTLQFLGSMNSNTPLRDAITAQGNYERGYAAGSASMPGDLVFCNTIMYALAAGSLGGPAGGAAAGAGMAFGSPKSQY
jgi:hypothetical protein